MFAEPPAMPYFDVQGSAYDSFLNTPANFEYFSSPNVNISGPNQGVISDGQVLFAPLDEFAAKDAAAAAAASSWNGNDLLGDLVNGYPGLHFDLVHALVNSISPTMAYQPVGDSSSSSSTMSMLLNQAQSLADVQFNSADAGEALLVDTLLGMLSPTADVETTPMLYDATTASPAMLELFSSVLSPAPPLAAAPAAPAAVAPVCCAPANDEDDVPLLKRKYSEEEVSVPQVQVEKPTKKRQFYCDICNRGFDRQYNLTTHKRTHDPKSKAARPFKCTECTHTFTRKHDLTRHMVTHNPDADIKCPECSRPFARLDVLERHMLAIHKDKA
ncbi:hypothetical protein H4S07_007109 [Coemansia furcata]|uniref:Uncharacterized protein n=1 Tax=Coemansia furcata TaxID=417177 RepID=A0ACC1KQH6_9FUNG|nr:hypothetical protein H4S07_007109 [Coemansia furcata]